jgi:acetyl-CoA carboxylase biotin carboxyl carrier protein
MVARGAVEVEIEDGAQKVRVRLREERSAGVMHYAHAPQSMGTPGSPAAAHASAGASMPAAEGDVFLSPMVGTFYRSASPDAEPFAEVGDRIQAEAPLCIIEAMKVMNEIKSEFAAEIVGLLVENGQTVEFGQPLFRLKRL